MLIYAHRGDQSQFPENTIEAFAAASQYPNVGIEFDVQITQDQQLVVFHDDELTRLCQVNGRIADFTYAKLQCIRVKGKYAIPTLEEVLDAYTGLGRINLEIKDPKATSAVIAFLKSYQKTQPERFRLLIISSFEKQPLRDFHQAIPEVERAYLCSEVTENTLVFLNEIQAAALHLHHEAATPEWIEICHENNRRLTVWTVNDLARIATLKTWGIDGIITDFPNQL